VVTRSRGLVSLIDPGLGRPRPAVARACGVSGGGSASTFWTLPSTWHYMGAAQTRGTIARTHSSTRLLRPRGRRMSRRGPRQVLSTLGVSMARFLMICGASHAPRRTRPQPPWMFDRAAPRSTHGWWAFIELEAPSADSVPRVARDTQATRRAPGNIRWTRLCVPQSMLAEPLGGRGLDGGSLQPNWRAERDWPRAPPGSARRTDMAMISLVDSEPLVAHGRESQSHSLIPDSRSPRRVLL